MTKLTLQEQMLKAGLVSSKKMAKVQRTAKKSRVQAREAREAVEENKKAQLERDKQLSEQQKQATLAKEFKAQVKQLIEMNRITVTRGSKPNPSVTVCIPSTCPGSSIRTPII